MTKYEALLNLLENNGILNGIRRGNRDVKNAPRIIPRNRLKRQSARRLKAICPAS